MNKLIIIIPFILFGLVSRLHAEESKGDIGIEVGALGSYGLTGHYKLEANMDIRALYTNFTATGTSCSATLSSIGAAAIINLPKKESSNMYYGLGGQNVGITGSCSGLKFLNGFHIYYAIGWKNQVSEEIDMRFEYNNLHGLTAGIAYRF